jgi:ribonuclease E
MLIDATHAEETRVVVVDGNALEEFDFETATRKQLKGNIYLAKVTRVEPSLQAAFVEYGGNRHGFLAFSEIHPDYFQIPVSDRKALLKQQKAEAEARANEAAEQGDRAEESPDENGDDVVREKAETVSAEEEDEIQRRPALHQKYRIQEVIKRRQIILVQVTKEERGTKGAALTTYVSLAGRYCVLMPNATRGGGISRKIQSGEARRRLRAVVSELDLPEGMAVILRTAGQERTKSEIKRDYDYLLRLWDSIREATLKASAPAMIHEEANLIKRSIRDLYRPKSEGILVEGEEGYRTAKAFMKMLMPSRAKEVQPYRDPTPLFHRYQVEGQLDEMHKPTVQLRSGGYVVINLTEALVSIDVNSGRATKERNIEETATKTNLEAADEVARQLRLRDLAGLIVIDFIDMEENRNCRAVERRMREAVRSDRARIQMGRISAFGLLEMSRQRLRPSLLEVSTEVCPHCDGDGRVRSVESLVLHALRAIEEDGIRGRSAAIAVSVPSAVARYLLNQKRATLSEIESRYGMTVTINGDDTPRPPECRIEQTLARETADAAATPETKTAPQTAPVTAPAEAADEASAEGRQRRPRRRRARGAEAEPESVAAAPPDEAATEATDEAREGETGEAVEVETPKPRRRRGKRGGRRRSRAKARQEGAEVAVEGTESASVEEAAAPAPEPKPAVEADATDAGEVAVADAPEVESADAAPAKPARRGRRRTKAKPRVEAEAIAADTDAATADETAAADDSSNGEAKAPRRRATGAAKKAPRKRPAKKTPEASDEATPAMSPPAEETGMSVEPANETRPDTPPKAPVDYGESDSPRRGWWQRFTGA